MAIISVYIPDTGIQRVYDAICSHYRYQSTIGADENGTPIPNPQSQAEFTNGVIRGFIAEHTHVYELELARAQAEAAAANAGKVVIDDGQTAQVYDYDMVCLAAAKDQYDALASVIAPGNLFHVPLSANGQDPATHYGVEAGITDTARQQLLVLELAGGTSTSGVQTLFYTRCDPQNHIAQSTNISGYDIVGQQCSFSGLISHLGLQEIIPPTGA